MTNERWRDHDLPTGGQVARFIKLHLDTLVRKDKHPHKEGESIYTIDGKTRPMLVLERLSRERGRRWFRVLPITTKGRDEGGNRRDDVEPIDNCIEADKVSFVEMRPQWLPDNLFDGSIIKPCDPIVFGHVLRILSTRRLGCKSGNNDENEEK